MQRQFVINGRFKINEAINMVVDVQTGIETRLEPRLMKLVMLLAANRGEVVTRQQIIKDIWDDYGNADEGLNQAISFLRKVFGDTDKQLIRTISKKGYILEATLSNIAVPHPVTARSVPGKPANLYIIIAGITIAAALTYFLIIRNTSKLPMEPPGTEIDTTYQHREMKESSGQRSDIEPGKNN